MRIVLLFAVCSLGIIASAAASDPDQVRKVKPCATCQTFTVIPFGKEKTTHIRGKFELNITMEDIYGKGGVKK